MLRRLRDSLRSKDQSTKLADIALKDEIAAFDLISSLGSTEEGVRETASGAIVEIARRDYDKLAKLVLRWSGERQYKLNHFLRWTDGLQSKNLDRLRRALSDRIKSATVVNQLIGEIDSVNEKMYRLKELYDQKRVTQQAYEILRKEYLSKNSEATQRILAQFSENSRQLEELSQTRAKLREELSILETRASLGDIGRKESEQIRIDTNKKLDDIRDQDRKLSEELTVMLMSSGPVKIYGENDRIIAMASDFQVDREKHIVELRARVLSEGDVQLTEIAESRDELIALIYGLMNKPAQAPADAPDKVTPEMVELVGNAVATELKVSTEEALRVEKLRYFLETASIRSGKAKMTMIPVRRLTPSGKGYLAEAGTLAPSRKTEVSPEPKPIQLPSEAKAAPPPAGPEKKPVTGSKAPLLEIKPIEKLPTPHEALAPVAPSEPKTAKSSAEPKRSTNAVEKTAEKPLDLTDQEIRDEVVSLQRMLDEGKGSEKSDNDDLGIVDDKVLDEVDKAVAKLKERMKSR